MESGFLGVRFRPVLFEGYRTGAVDIGLADRRIISVPSQLGCRVACTFCISSATRLVRNLSADEMLQLVRTCLDGAPPDDRPIELSFTGEGEPALNWRAAAQVCSALPDISANFDCVRYSFSGLGAASLLGKLDGGGYPTRLQFSLHAARDSVRSALVPRTAPLADILEAMRRHQSQFSGVELNVVLQDGVNDSDEDLDALISWGDAAWPILLNPLLSDGTEKMAARTEHFREKLFAAGRVVRQYRKIAAQISREGVYPLMTARATKAAY
ncbi:radical SAM protein [Paraburkholderia sp. UCT31]|uniref:radical SAM protein n=1 Tax=Paraburkholderia sp. UCT31 TaxID=2615209 RepID=UPI00223BDCCA|nr:radical SAM protein [Paraburkholderia sp. UCT31]MBC8739738.1 radical SAM protein [Paraburkholderia sp. UCT31]